MGFAKNCNGGDQFLFKDVKFFQVNSSARLRIKKLFGSAVTHL
jgi:hypothetical protein